MAHAPTTPLIAEPRVPELPDVPVRVRRGTMLLLATLTVMSTVGTALSPYLLVEHPLLLVALCADGRHVVLAAAEAPLVPLLIVATLRRVLSLLLTYGLGAIYGVGVVTWIEGRFSRTGRLIRGFENLLRRIGPPILGPMPGYTPALLAGVARLPLWAVTLWLTLGTALWMGLTVAFGDAVSDWSGMLITWLGEHVVGATAVCVVLVVAWQIIGRLRGQSSWKPPFAQD